jgi:putative redox protein
VEHITIPSSETKLNAVIHQADKNTNKILIISHGFRGSKDGSGKAVMLAEQAAAIGFSVVRYDFTPCQTLSSQVEELTSVIHYCRQHSSAEIVLLGRSMGGSASLLCAAADDAIKGIALWATPCNLSETFRLALGKDYELLENGEQLLLDDNYGRLELKPEFIYDFAKYDLMNSMQIISNRKVPVLIIHGTNDELVPLKQAKQLFEIACQPKMYVQIDGGDHQFNQHGAVASSAVINWLKNTFRIENRSDDDTT